MTSPVILLRHSRFAEHLLEEPCEDIPARYRCIEEALWRSELMNSLPTAELRPATEEELSLVHSPGYISRIKEQSKQAEEEGKPVQIYYDTFVDATTFEIASLAARAGLVAMDNMLGGEAFQNAFVAARPPGHHATTDRGLGYCYFNNIALAAQYARAKYGLKKVAILDWDVHHGNGTEEIFYEDPDILFVSIHEQWLFPEETGWYLDNGRGAGRGFNINIPILPGTGDSGYLKILEEIVEPIFESFEPQLILISSGFDAHKYDPLGHQNLSVSGYVAMLRRLLALNQRIGTGNGLGVFLEGGYSQRALAQGTLACLKVLGDLEENRPDNGVSTNLSSNRSDQALKNRLDLVKSFHGHWWSSLR